MSKNNYNNQSVKALKDLKLEEPDNSNNATNNLMESPMSCTSLGNNNFSTKGAKRKSKKQISDNSTTKSSSLTSTPAVATNNDE